MNWKVFWIGIAAFWLLFGGIRIYMAVNGLPQECLAPFGCTEK